MDLVAWNCDLLIAIGSHLCISQTTTIFEAFAREAKIVMIDIDKNELEHKTVKIDLPICCDAKQFLKGLKNVVSPSYWANKIGENSGLYGWAIRKGEQKKPWYIQLALILVILLLFFFMAELQADDNHVHVDQVGTGGDEITLTIDQIGHNNEVAFSFAHINNNIILYFL